MPHGARVSRKAQSLRSDATVTPENPPSIAPEQRLEAFPKTQQTAKAYCEACWVGDALCVAAVAMIVAVHDRFGHLACRKFFNKTCYLFFAWNSFHISNIT